MIPFNKAVPVGREAAYVADAIASGHISGGGAYSTRVRGVLEAAFAGARVLLTTSCSDALEMAALLLGIGPGDEVIVPSFAFVTVAGAFALRGARLVFADSRADTFNLDETTLEALITPRTRAIVVIHYAGVAAAMAAIMAIAGRHGIAVVEDVAHGPFGSDGGRPLGRFGALACLSFHETKTFSCGEGGALIVNDPALWARAEVILEKGTDRRRFLDGAVDKYTWRDLGGSFVLSDLLAAFLLGQLEARPVVEAARRAIWRRYDQGLAAWARSWGIVCPQSRPDAPPCHSYALLMPDEASRTAFIAHLRGRGVMAVFHYLPLHLSEMGRRHGGRPGDHPVAEAVAQRIVRLPFFTTLTPADQDRVIDAVLAFTPARGVKSEPAAARRPVAAPLSGCEA